MVPAGYMAKRVSGKPDWLLAPQVTDIFSVSGCMSEDFADYINFWKHNGYWLFDSPEIIQAVAAENSISLDGTSLFYYEVFEQEFGGREWAPYAPEKSFPINVMPPLEKKLEGYDVVAPGHSPLSCNGLANQLRTNAHCLFDSFEQAHSSLSSGAFDKSEPGPYRIFAVYSAGWPSSFRVSETETALSGGRQ